MVLCEAEYHGGQVVVEPNPSPYGSQEKEGKEKEKLQTKYTLPLGGGGTRL